jgi:hypothetical protein
MVQKPDLKIIEPYDVSFAELRLTGNWEETVQRIATAINVQFTESSESLPFVPSRQFASLLREEKIFLIGPSGSGKSRTIIELLRNKRADYERIFVINPSNPAGLNSGRENISKLSQRFGPSDLVIWDNFPDGLVKRDLESAFGALEMVNARPVQNMYIALKPTYLEMYRGLTTAIPDIYTHEIYCDLDTMKSMLKVYGNVEQYKRVSGFITSNIDRIARILWQKQPLSLTVVDYYKALEDRPEGTVDEATALQMAQTWLPAYDYFERQFEVIKSMQGRRDEVDFLHILRFCYEVGFDRTHSSLASLQRKIFGSEPPAEPTRELGTWLYLSGQNYSMHDSAKNGVKLTDYARMKITSYLAQSFSEIVPAGSSELHSLGVFLGKNIEFIPQDETGLPIPGHIYGFMKKNSYFERALGRGVGENFERLDDVLQERILRLVDTEIEFGVGLADSLGERFTELDDFNRQRIMDKVYQGMLFARYFGQSVGRLYGKLSGELQSLVTFHSEKNPQFADGLGMGLGYTYATLEPELQRDILGKAKSNFDISRGVGFGFGLTIGLLGEDGVKNVLALADNNSELNTGFGMGVALSYSSLSDNLRAVIFERVANDAEFAFGFGVYSAFSFKESCPPEIFGLLSSNTEVAYGLGLGYGPIYFYLSENFRRELDVLQKENVKLDDGIGSGIGFVLNHFPAEAQEALFGKAAVRNAFATGLGYGIGYVWGYVNEALRKRAVTLAGINNDFARGLGFGFGCRLDRLEPEYLAQVIAIANSNSELDRGLGGGAAWAWPYFGESARVMITDRLDTRTEFARGMGVGLARMVKQFSKEDKEPLLGRLERDHFFAEGLSEGTAQYLWSIYSKQEKQDLLALAASSTEVSRGLGTGLGFLHSYFSKELEGGTLQAFLKKNPEMRRGVGRGMGRAFKYLPENARREAFRMADDDVAFATGFGQGLGTIFNYLDDSERGVLWSSIGENGFSKGLGIGLGTILAFLPDDVLVKLFNHSENKMQLSMGLGTGTASILPYLDSKLASKVFEQAKSDPFLAAGLGEGSALAFAKLSDVARDRIKEYGSMEGFSYGFGLGIGKVRRYLAAGIFENAASLVRGNFMEGYAVGLGNQIANMSAEFLHEIMPLTSDGDFARNFGFGAGHAISLLSSEARKELFDRIKPREEFLAGLGEGVGHSLPVTGTQIVEELLQSFDSTSLAKGTARGVSEVIAHLDMVEVLGMVQYAGSNPDFGRIMGSGIAAKFSGLDQEIQSLIIDALQRDTAFSRAFVKALPAGEPMSSDSRQKIIKLIAKYPHLEAESG